MSSKDSDKEVSSTALAEANNFLGLNLYKVLSKQEDNIFFSPLSLSSALTMLYYGALDETAEELKTVLGYGIAQIKDEDIKLHIQELMHEIGNDPDSYKLTSANSLLYQKGLVVKDEYKQLLSEFFEAFLQEVDIAHETEKAVMAVNDFVSEKTQNMIPSFLDSLDPETVLVILNAIYFKGFWKYPFDKESTRLRNFYVKGRKENAKEVPMMYINKKFRYAYKESFSALELPYEGADIAMMILLPDSVNGLPDLEISFNDDLFQDVKRDLVGTRMDVVLPKFKLEFSKSFEDALQLMGLEKVFSTGAQLGGISDDEKLLVSKIFHKAVIDVNEEGSEASAATGIEIVPMCLPPDFTVDHPFMFYIYNTKTNMILFMGRVEDL